MRVDIAIDPGKLDAFVSRFVQDLGAVIHAATVLLGDKLGLYKAMADGVPLTPDELARRTSTDARYVREWLCAQAASGYVEYAPATGLFRLPEEQAFALTQEFNPLFIPGGLQIAAAAIKDEAPVLEAFRSGRGVGWHEHCADLFAGTERFFRPGYIASLTSAWLPALDGVQVKLERGAHVADVGCGHGSSTIVMAQAFPNSSFVGFDYHASSIAAAKLAAAAAGVTARVRFEVAKAKEFPGSGYDLVTAFDCLHDMGDPVGAAKSNRRTVLQRGGSARSGRVPELRRAPAGG